MEKVKPVILVICDYYLPGLKGGGALRALVNLVERLGGSYQFKLITRDHDGPLNKTPYQNVEINNWNRIGKADIYYLSQNEIRIGRIKQLINENKPDAIYLNSFFSPLTIFTLLLGNLDQIEQIPIILVPEGELTPGALKIKSLKKRLYIYGSNKLLKLQKNVIWKAASAYEQDHLKKILDFDGRVFIAPSLTEKIILEDFNLGLKPEKTSGQVKFVFLSRIARKKNLHWFLEQIGSAAGEISIDIYGPEEDTDYWKQCLAIIQTLSENINVKYLGEISYEKVPATLLNYHFFVLPTLDENFGLVFVEALAAGCPLLISDRTPWQDLEKQGIGWDIPLEGPNVWQNAINYCVHMNNEDFQQMSENARKFAVEWLADSSHEESYRELFDFALEQGKPYQNLA